MESHLKWADYVIFVGFLGISLAIGIYHSLTGGRQKTVAEFIMGNRRLKVIPTAISLIATFRSAILLLGMTAEMYSYGIQYLFSAILALTLALLIVERIIVPWLYPMKLVSIYDYLERRYMSKSVRIFGSLMGILTSVLYMGVVMYPPSAALESATGLPISVSIPVVAIVSVAYTAIGGMRAVIWTDVFQFIAMVVGIVAILVRGLVVVGGITKVFELSGVEGRLVFTNFSFDPRVRQTFWTFMIGYTLNTINTYGLAQSAVQRFSAVDKLQKARIMVLLTIPVSVAAMSTTCIIGLIVLAYYSSIKCDPLANKDISNPNMLLPFFVATIFADSPGFTGLFLSALYGGSLSSISSAISAAAANCWEDILDWKLNHLPESRKVLINKILVVFFGVLSIGVAFFAASVSGPVTQVVTAMLNSVYGPLFAMFVLGAVSRHANWKGVLVGGIVGIFITLWLCIGSLTVRYTYPLPPLSVQHCYPRNGTYTFSTQTLTNYTSFEVFDRTGAMDSWEQTTEILAGRRQATQLQGLQNFYAMSYMLFIPFGAIITAVIGIIASFIMRDKDLESRVDEHLLLRINLCGWAEENRNNELLDDDRKTSLCGVTAPDEKRFDDFAKNVEMTVSQHTGNQFNKENNDDGKKVLEYVLLTEVEQGTATCLQSSA